MVQQNITGRQEDTDGSISLEQVVHRYREQPKLLELILSSKAEEDRRRAEEARLRQRELDYLLKVQSPLGSSNNSNLAREDEEQEPRRTTAAAIKMSPSWRTLPVPSITIHGTLTQHQEAENSSYSGDRIECGSADSFVSRMEPTSCHICPDRRASVTPFLSTSKQQNYFPPQNDRTTDFFGRPRLKSLDYSRLSGDRASSSSIPYKKNSNSLDMLLSEDVAMSPPARQVSCSSSSAVTYTSPDITTTTTLESADQIGETRLDAPLRFNSCRNSSSPSRPHVPSNSSTGCTEPKILPSGENGYVWTRRQRRRQRRKMQAITMIIETREFPYNDKYLWKNNGNTVHKKSGLRSIYYKCSNSTKVRFRTT
ncbi:hypothetical protein DFQ28_002266 [Apophysomyces sp. BC1034]|nr:hypothetical protein DFQ28_002266 [Apophysomyces sp. BC1034]